MLEDVLSECATHPGHLAPWSCATCGLRCAACVARVQTEAATWDACTACDGPVTRVMVPGPVDRLPTLAFQALRAAIGLPTLVVLVASFAAAIALRAAEQAFATLVIVSLVLGAVTAAGVFLLIHLAANGPDEVKSAAPIDLRAIAGNVPWLAVPFAILFASAPAASRVALSLIAFAGGALVPNVAVWRLTRSTRPGLVPMLASGVLCAFAALCLRNATDADELMLVTTSVPLRAFAILALLLIGWITGLFLHVRAIELGWPLPPRYRVPLDPNAVPTGTARPRPPPPPRSRAPIDLD